MVVAVFLSNLPEAISATAGLHTAGWRGSRIFALWAVGLFTTLGFATAVAVDAFA